MKYKLILIVEEKECDVNILQQQIKTFIESINSSKTIKSADICLNKVNYIVNINYTK